MSLEGLNTAQCWVLHHFHVNNAKDMKVTVDDITDVMRSTLENQALRNFFRLDLEADTEERKFDQSSYEKNIKPLLIEKITNLFRSCTVTQNEIEQIKIALTGSFRGAELEKAMTYILGAEEKLKKRFCVSRYLLEHAIPHAVSKRLGIDYGPSTSSKLAVPYKVKHIGFMPTQFEYTPMPANFADRYELTLLTLLCYMRKA